MFFGNAFEALLRTARVALASLLLVGVPIADAVACTGEEFPSHAAIAASDDEAASTASSTRTSDHGNQPASEGQHCIHGHCHHSTPLRISDATVRPADGTTLSVVWPENQRALERAPSGLERPPRI